MRRLLLRLGHHSVNNLEEGKMPYETCEDVKKSRTRNQYFAAAVCTLVCLCCGCFHGWASYSVPQLVAKNQTILIEPLSSQEAALIGSLPNIGAFLGIPLYGWISNRFGRKIGTQLLAVPFIICYVTTSLAPSANYLIIGRFIGGFGGGGAATLPSLYTGESAEASVRGTLGSFISLGFNGGCVVSFVLGALSGYFTVTSVFLVMLVVFAILMAFMPETPVFLVKNGREEEAAKSLAWLRGSHVNSQIVRNEIAYLRKQIHGTVELIRIKPPMKLDKINDPKTLESTKVSFSEVAGPKTSRPAWKQLVLDKASRNAFLTAAMVFTCHAMAGLYAVITNASEIFKASGIEMSSNVCSIFYSLLLVAGSVVCMFLVDKAGRKVLMTSSLGGISALFFIIGFTMHTGYGPSYVPAVAIMSCAIIFNSGAGSVPYILLGEYFADDVRDLAAGILVQYLCLLIFLIIHLFRAGMEMFGIHGMFYIYGANCLLGALLCFFLQPETKGLKTEEILAIFGREYAEPDTEADVKS